MPKMIWAFLLLGSVQAAPWSAFVPVGDTVFQQQLADINGDGQQDRVIITEKGSEQGADQQGKRTLLVLLGRRSKDNSKSVNYTLSAKSERVVLCRGCGGVWGDPFADLQVGKGWLSLSDYGGSNWRWGHTYHFVWRSGGLTLDRLTEYARNPYEHEQTTDISPSECQEPRLNGFLCGVEADENYVVKSARAYFYAAPNITARQKKYVVAGDQINIWQIYKHFAYGAYEAADSAAGMSDGYFLRSDLQKLP